jgi:hypothetical protein
MDISSLFKSRALSIVVLVAGFLLFFGVMTQFSWDGITTFYIAAFTLGLCGLPTTFAGVVVWAAAGKLLHLSDTATYWGGVVVMAVCFVLQWSFLAASAQRRGDE